MCQNPVMEWGYLLCFFVDLGGMSIVQDFNCSVGIPASVLSLDLVDIV